MCNLLPSPPLPVPDLHIEGTLEAIHVMLDKSQLELVKGLLDLNLGEGVEEFEKPSTVILDPVHQVHKHTYMYDVYIHIHAYVYMPV